MLFQELVEMHFTCRVIAHFSFPQHRKWFDFWILLESKINGLFVPLTASPPRFVSVEELMETAKGVTNMALAHEIMVNSAFQVKPAELPEGRWECWLETVALCWLSNFLILISNTHLYSLERRVKEIMHKAFWDCLEAQMKEDPPTYGHAIKLLAEIKEVRRRVLFSKQLHQVWLQQPHSGLIYDAAAVYAALRSVIL